jgi:hypothetical protein
MNMPDDDPTPQVEPEGPDPGKPIEKGLPKPNGPDPGKTETRGGPIEGLERLSDVFRKGRDRD